MIIITINIVNPHPAQSPESRPSKSRRSGRCLVMLISVMMKFAIINMKFAMKFAIINMKFAIIKIMITIFIMIMPMNESAEGTTVFPRAAHVAHMDTRVALLITI